MELRVGAPFELVWRNEELENAGPRPDGSDEEHRMETMSNWFDESFGRCPVMAILRGYSPARTVDGVSPIRDSVSAAPGTGDGGITVG